MSPGNQQLTIWLLARLIDANKQLRGKAVSVVMAETAIYLCPALCPVCPECVQNSLDTR